MSVAEVIGAADAAECKINKRRILCRIKMVPALPVKDNRSGPVVQNRENRADVIAPLSPRAADDPVEAGVPAGSAGKARISNRVQWGINPKIRKIRVIVRIETGRHQEAVLFLL